MHRWSIPLIGLILFGSPAFGPLAFGQGGPASNTPLFSSDLVMWSYMQEPQQPEPGQMHQTPTPDPRPETPRSPTAPAQQTSPATAGSQPASTQTFTGTISKEADSFTLQVSKTVSYKLDNQPQVQQYEGQRVRVTGTLDSSANLIHVDKIEPLS